MTIERILSDTAAGPLIGGLGWRPPSGGRHSLRRLHEARNLTTDATHYTLLEAGGAVVYGLYQPRPSEETVRLGKGVQSAAHCFASRVGAEAPNGALLLSVAAAGHRRDEKVYVVVLEDGVPVVDSLTTEMEARNALGSEDRPIWSDTPSLYPNSHDADLAWLAAGATKASRLVPIPLNPWPWVSAAAAITVLSVGWWWVRDLREAEARDEEARQLAASDPTPRYLAELARRSGTAMTDRQVWHDTVSSLFERPVAVPGWRMKSVECDAATARCDTWWQRRGGTFQDLRAALPDQALVLSGVDANPVPPLDNARTTVPFVVRRQAWPATESRLPRLADALGHAGSLFQVWKTADLAIDLQPPRLWPRADAVPPTFAHPQALLSGVVTVSEVPGPFVLEALGTAPPWISWENVRAEVGEGDVATRLKFKATGNYYVSLQ